jgi:hypothetical protein
VGMDVVGLFVGSNVGALVGKGVGFSVEATGAGSGVVGTGVGLGVGLGVGFGVEATGGGSGVGGKGSPVVHTPIFQIPPHTPSPCVHLVLHWIAAAGP